MIEAGTLFKNRYEIIEKIGSGGMADVFKAKDKELGRYVAVKVLKAEYSEDDTFVKKFRDEAQSAAGLSHPNIVSVYDVGAEMGTHFIVMELVEGITLKNYIEMKHKLDVKEALNISVQIAQGLGAAHDKGIFHRDIKPQNIIMSRDGKVKITDFGIAKKADSQTITTTAAGTVQYISPEQARGGYSDEKSDIYSLGITMYEMVTGEVPFQGENNVAVALHHIQSEMVSPRTLEPDLPVSFEKIILKCTQKKPDYRYASARELIADLRKVLAQPDGAYVKIGAPTGNTIVMDDKELANIKNQRKRQISDGTGGKAVRTENNHKKKAIVPDDDYYDNNDDDDNDETGLSKLMMVLGIIGFVILLIIIGYLIANASGLLSGRSKKATETEAVVTESVTETETESETSILVPDLKGMTREEATEALNSLGLGIQVENGYDKDAEVGEVYDQSPAANEPVERHTQIKVYINEGKLTFALPDVVGKDYQQAQDQLESKGLKVTLEFEKNDDIEKNEVIKTDPEAGEQVAEGDTITIYACEGPVTEKVEVPDLRGYTLDSAKNMIEEAGLTFDGSSEAYSDYYEEGQVMGQSLTAGTSVAKGTSIGVTVSLGIQNKSYETYTTVPDPFENMTDEEGNAVYEGEILIQMTQDGMTTNVYNQYCTSATRPSVLKITSASDSEATVALYVNGSFVSEWAVTFYQ